MSNAELTFDQVLEEFGITAKWEARAVQWEARGEARGKSEGKFEGKFEVARNALNEGLSVDFIQRITGLPVETINKLAADGE
ncbi:hypothetical protein AGMMS49942_14910 [Spirochaetia bacterium]|nr:hypothetical protein AGMMS49942_14910 [Spirochaetia bacterium]